MQRSKEGLTAVFILSFVIITSSFVSTAILLNELHPSNKLTGLAILDTKTEENTTTVAESFLKEEKKPDYSIIISEVNDSLGLCNITQSSEWITGNCSTSNKRFILQLLVENVGDYRILDLKNSFYCYDTDKTGFWSLLGSASEGAIYEQKINEQPRVAVFEPNNEFIYKLNAERKEIKNEKVNCDVRFYSSETPIQLKKRIFLNFSQIKEEIPFDSKAYLNSIIYSVNRGDFRKATYG